MKTKLFCLFFCICLGRFSFSQEIKYYDKDENEIDSINSFYWMKGKYVEATGWVDTVKSYFTQNNQLRSKELFHLGVLEGPSYFYHSNGKLKEKINYKKGVVFGIVTEFYPTGKAKSIKLFNESIKELNLNKNYLIVNAWDTLGRPTVVNYQGYFSDDIEEGKIKSGVADSIWITYQKKEKIMIEKYKQGVLIEGDRFMNGQTIHYTKFAIQAEPKGGLTEFYRYIGKNIKYPASAKRKEFGGKVFVGFVIEKDGRLSNIRVIRGLDNEFEKEAIRVVSLSGPWNPGYKQGVIVRQRYVLPITFTLSE
jgi:TonB family protein